MDKYRLIYSATVDKYQIQKLNWFRQWETIRETPSKDDAFLMWDEITKGPEIIREITLQDDPQYGT